MQTLSVSLNESNVVATSTECEHQQHLLCPKASHHLYSLDNQHGHSVGGEPFLPDAKLEPGGEEVLHILMQNNARFKLNRGNGRETAFPYTVLEAGVPHVI